MTWNAKQTLVSSAAVSANTASAYSAATSAVSQVALEMDVSVAPAVDTSVRLLMQTSFDGVNWTKARTCGAFVGVDSVGRYGLTVVVDMPYIRFALMPLEWGITAGLSASTR